MRNNELKSLAKLINDSVTGSGKVALFNENAAKYTDQAVREGFFEILGEDKLTWQSYENHKREIFTVMEDVLKINLPLAWENSDFYDNYVDVRNYLLGDTNEFIVDQDGLLVVSEFSGNHWDTKRQRVYGKSSFSITTSWLYVRIYNDLERFLKSLDSLQEMVTKLQKSFSAEIDSRVYAAFNGIGTYLPAKFQETGTYDKSVMNDLIQRVQLASQRNVTIAGTQTALSNIVDGMNASWISEAAKNELATTGRVVNNIGLPCRALVIPQAFLRGTYDFKVDNNTIYVIPEGTKPIKLVYEGDVRSRDLGSQDTMDQTIDQQVQVKLGVGVVCDSLIATYKIV